MTDSMTNRYIDGKVLYVVQRQRRWTSEEKVRLVEETPLLGMSVSLVARQQDTRAYFMALSSRSLKRLEQVFFISLDSGRITCHRRKGDATFFLGTAIGLRFMGLADDIINLAFGLILGAIAVAFALAFGLGGRDAAARMVRRLDSSTTPGAGQITPQSSTTLRPGNVTGAGQEQQL